MVVIDPPGKVVRERTVGTVRRCTIRFQEEGIA